MGKVSHTPGPWGWFGTDHGIYLATKHSGRRFVMGFRRLGMHGAQPTFQIDKKGMFPASELVQFEVGTKSVRGFKEAKSNGTVYRYDVTAIDHPDARLIASAPEILEALIAALPYVETAESDEGYKPGAVAKVSAQMRAAIAKATGGAE